MSQEQPFFQQIRNTANVTLDVVLSAVNTAIGVAYTQANNAYTQANNGVGIGQSAYAQANAAYNQANTATAVGQAAYAEANTAASTASSAASAASAAQTTANQGISSTGVSAGSYGTGTKIAAFTVGANGRLSQANTISIPTFSTGTNGLVAAPSSSANNIFLDSQGNFIVPLGGGDQSASASGWTTLPGGIILQWGYFAGQSSSPALIYFNKGFPTACFSVIIQPVNDSESEFVKSVNASNFTYGFGASNTPIYWMAIGQ